MIAKKVSKVDLPRYLVPRRIYGIVPIVPTANGHCTRHKQRARAAKPATKPNNKDRATMKMNIIMAIYTDLHHNGWAQRLIFTLAMVSSAFGALNLIGNQRQMIGRPPPAPTSLALSPNNLRRISIHPLPSVQTPPIKCLHILSVYRPRSCMGRLRRAP